MPTDYRPRFAFDISEELQSRCQRLFPTHGMRKDVMTAVLCDLLDLIEEHGQVINGLIVDHHLKPREVIPSMASAEKKVKVD